MPNGGKQYVNEKVQQYQQWAAEHPEANEYVKFAAYSGSAYAGYKGAAAMDAAWAARKAAKEKAKAVAREVAAQSRIAQNQAAQKAANNAINERAAAAAKASKPLPYKAPAAPKPVTTPKPTANNPSSPKPTNAPKPVMPAPMPYVPAAVARSGADDFAGAVAARAAQQVARKEADALAPTNIGVNQTARTAQNNAVNARQVGSVAAQQAAKNSFNLAELFRQGRRTTGHPNQVEAQLADGTKILFRKEAHPFNNHPEFKGKGNIEHYNIEIQVPKQGVRNQFRTGNKKIEDIHIIPDGKGGYTVFDINGKNILK